MRLHRSLRTLGVLTLMLVATAAAPSAASAATCSDYDNQADAQRAADTRDADGDGIYCEALPCPCLRPGQGGGSKPPRKKRPRKRAEVIRAVITDVVDGDTIKVRATGGKRYTVRLIGIDTPETKKPGVRVECGGPEASANMLRLGFTDPQDTDGDGLVDDEGGQGRKVRLTTDPTQDKLDRFKRLLAYADTSGGQLNVAQVADGWSKTYVFRKRFKQYPRFIAAQGRAKDADRGVWGACAGDFHSEQRTLARVEAAACNTVRYGGRAYVLYRQGRVGCTFAKRWVRRLRASAGRNKPPGWRCSSGSRYRTGGGCTRSNRTFGWHPAD